MNIEILDEPELEFASGRHVDIRFGLMDYGPLSRLAKNSTAEIKVGIVGTPETIEGVCGWLERCRKPIDAKKSRRANLFPYFPGFSQESSWGCRLALDTSMQRSLSPRDFAKLISLPVSAELVESAVELFIGECRDLADKGIVQVLVCAPPSDLLDRLDTLDDSGGDSDASALRAVSSRKRPRVVRPPAFHDVLKARGMSLSPPIQMVRPSTYDPAKRKMQTARPELVRELQDEATRAWNFHTALYYKAGGALWRLTTDRSALSACYLGVSFYRTTDESVLMTSMAQLFNERGDGVVVRGGQVVPDKNDLQPHLDRTGASELLRDALRIYRKEHKTLLARIVVHKTSSFSALEREGFLEAADAERINSVDLIWVTHSVSKLFRPAVYPPLRGTLWQLESNTSVLYTRGSVSFYSAYPGLYVPQPVRLEFAQVEQTPRFLAKEILALTKMNWNSTQFDHREPITIDAARRVGSILKHVPEGGILRPRYAHYM